MYNHIVRLGSNISGTHLDSTATCVILAYYCFYALISLCLLFLLNSGPRVMTIMTQLYVRKDFYTTNIHLLLYLSTDAK